MSGKRELAWIVLCALAIPIACGGSSEEGLYGNGNPGSGGVAGSTSLGGSAGVAPTGGSAGVIDSGGAAGADAATEAASSDAAPPPVDSPPPILDAAPEGNNPLACPPSMPAPGSACNVFVNNSDCVYGFKHCVCSITTWLCVP
jgi:hypothetical protein